MTETAYRLTRNRILPGVMAGCQGGLQMFASALQDRSIN